SDALAVVKGHVPEGYSVRGWRMGREIHTHTPHTNKPPTTHHNSAHTTHTRAHSQHTPHNTHTHTHTLTHTHSHTHTHTAHKPVEITDTAKRRFHLPCPTLLLCCRRPEEIDNSPHSPHH